MLNIKSKDCINYIYILVAGELNITTTSDFSNEIIKKYDKSNVILDFTKLNYISSAGLRCIVTLYKNLACNECRLSIVSLTGVVRDVFEISGFLDVIEFFENLHEAQLSYEEK